MNRKNKATENDNLSDINIKGKEDIQLPAMNDLNRYKLLFESAQNALWKKNLFLRYARQLSIINCMKKEKSLERHWKKEISCTRRYINLLQELSEDYLSIVQTSSLNFRQKNLAMDLENYLSKLPNVLSTTVKTDGKEEKNYCGNYRIIFFIIHSVLKYMLRPVDKYILVCRMIDQPTEIPGKLPILLELDFKNRLGVDKNSETWETVKGFIGEVCKILDIKLKCI